MGRPGGCHRSPGAGISVPPRPGPGGRPDPASPEPCGRPGTPSGPENASVAPHPALFSSGPACGLAAPAEGKFGAGTQRAAPSSLPAPRVLGPRVTALCARLFLRVHPARSVPRRPAGAACPGGHRSVTAAHSGRGRDQVAGLTCVGTAPGNPVLAGDVPPVRRGPEGDREWEGSPRLTARSSGCCSDCCGRGGCGVPAEDTGTLRAASGNSGAGVVQEAGEHPPFVENEKRAVTELGVKSPFCPKWSGRALGHWTC